MGWPSGRSNLVVPQGRRYVVGPNTFPNFKSVLVQPGATLEIGTQAWATSPWMQIGCAGDFILRGTLLIRGSPLFNDDTYVWNASDGTVRTVEFRQSSGGAGGSAFGTAHKPGGTPGTSAYGNGGGGAATSGVGEDAQPAIAGTGGRAKGFDDSQWLIGAGGVGGKVATSEDQIAESGFVGGSVSGGYGCIAGGGGGGARGLHGGFLYLRVLGDFDAEGGTIDASGADGAAGGAGGGASHPKLQIGQYSGAGGGGGAGGNGGFVIVSYRRGLKKGWESVAAGSRGEGGEGGPTRRKDHRGRSGLQGQDGTPGQIHYLLEP